MSERTVFDIATRTEIVEGAPNRTLESAILIMGTKKFRRLPITKLGKIRGILTVTDIIRAIAIKGLPDGFDEEISDWMTQNPKTVRPSAPVKEAIREMSFGNFGSLLVLDDENQILIGIVTERDILKHTKDMEIPEVLEHLDKDIIERGFVMIPNTTSLEDAVVEMNTHRTHRILLTSEDGSVSGILSANDITSLCSREREEIFHNANFLKSINANFIASHNVLTIKSTATVSEAVKLMCEENIGGLPVVRDSKVIGIFTERSLIHYLAHKI